MLRRPCPAARGNIAVRTSVRANAMSPRYGPGLSAGLASLCVADAAFAIEEAVASSGATDVISLVQDNPLLASAAALVAIGGVTVAASLRPAKIASTGATDAFDALKAEERCILVDIRPKSVLKEEGVVDLKEANKKPLSLVYAEPDEEGDLVVDPEFAAKLHQEDGVSEESIVILFDSDGTLSSKAAEDLARDGFFKEKVYWVRGGMEGPKGWKESELPTKPYRVFELPLPTLELPSVDLAALAAELQAQVPGVDLTGTVEKVNEAVTVITDKYKENPSLANGVLAAAGIVTVGAFAITELDAILQVVGALGLARFLAGNLLFAKDREATLANVRAFLKERGFDVSNVAGSGSAGGAASAAGSGAGTGTGAGGSGSAQLQQLADIVMGAKDADSAAQQIADQMVPEVKGVDREALAAALKAAGFQLPMPLPEPAPVPAAAAAVTEAAAAAETPLAAATTPTAAEPVPVAPTFTAAVEVPEVTGPVAAPEAPAAAATVAAAAEAPAPVAVQEAPAVISVPANVLEAREWIAAWKQRGIEATAATTVVSAGIEVPEMTAPVTVPGAPTFTAAVEVPEVAPAVVEPEAPAAVATLATAAEVPAVISVPANVLEAREWIAAWKQRGSEATTAAAMVVEVPEATAPVAVPEAPSVSTPAPANVLEAREWIAAWKQRGVEAAAVVAATQSPPSSSSPVSGEEEDGVPEASSSLLDDGVESALAPANVLAAREWIASWKQVRPPAPARAEAAVPALAPGDGASDSDPPAEVAEERATVSVVA